MNADSPGIVGDGSSWPRHCETVRPEWVDYNGHMNVAFYVLIFDHATDAALDRLMLGEEYRRRTGCSVFVGEMHVTYGQEVLAGEELTVTTRLLASDDKRLVLFHEMASSRKATVASNEVLCVHVDLHTRRAAPWPVGARETFARALASQARQPPPKQAGRSIRLTSRSGPRAHHNP
jgi:acyl-CoA thioester hydrolase